MAEATTPERRGPLDDRPLPAGNDAARLAPAGFGSLVNLRCRPEDTVTVAAVEEALGASLPPDPNRVSEGSGRAVLWLGPDEWLVVAADGEAPELERRIRDTAGDDPWLSVTDLSHNYTGLALSGTAAVDVLAKGCPLDLHPRSFGPGDCAQTVLAGTRVLLRATATGTFELWVRNSFARYTAAWLEDAMQEFTA